MSIKSKTCRMIQATTVAMLLILGPNIAQAIGIDITTLPGYGVATSSVQNYNGSGGTGGWSVPTGKVVLGANIISAGDSISDFAAFRPGAPGETVLGYTFGAGEYGWRLQDNGLGANNGVQFEVYYADLMAGYTISESSEFGYNGAGGYGGWSAPAGQVVSGGGYAFSNSGSYATVSALGLENSVWPHYTFGANEQGWVVAGPNNNVSPNPGRVYVISFDAPASVPDGGATLALMAFALTGLGSLRRKFSV